MSRTLMFGLVLLVVSVSLSLGQSDCPCPRNMDPVCGTDGVTYNNECLLNCAFTAHKGRCLVKRELKPGCACQLNYDPVCGADGVTYSNLCARNCAGVGEGYDGECTA